MNNEFICCSDESRVWSRFKRISDAVRLPDCSGLPDLSMYNLRHSCATLLLSDGEDLKVVSERLGHATIKLTADTYIGALSERQQAATDRMQRMFG